jgi:hypothetical protein
VLRARLVNEPGASNELVKLFVDDKFRFLTDSEPVSVALSLVDRRFPVDLRFLRSKVFALNERLLEDWPFGLTIHHRRFAPPNWSPLIGLRLKQLTLHFLPRRRALVLNGEDRKFTTDPYLTVHCSMVSGFRSQR